MRLLYMKPKLVDLSQGSRIAFVRQFRHMTQDEVSDRLGVTGECKRRTGSRSSFRTRKFSHNYTLANK